MALAHWTIAMLSPPKPNALFAVLMPANRQHTKVKAGLTYDADTSFLACGLVLQMLKKPPLRIERGEPLLAFLSLYLLLL